MSETEANASAALAECARAPGVEAEAAQAGTALDLLLLRIGARWFAAEAACVREVGMKSRVTRVPTAPRHVLGVALVQGRLVPVVAFEGLFGAIAPGETAATLPRLVVLADGGLEVGLVADETRGVIHRELAAAERMRSQGDRAWITGEFEWNGALVGLIDVAALIAAAGRAEG